MADKFRPPNLPERNPITRKTHRREVFWQITFPLILGAVILLLCVAGVLVTTFQGTARLGTWAAVSEIILVVPAMFAALILLALVGGTAYLITRLLAITPYYARLVQDIFVLIAVRVRKAADAAVEPILRLNGFSASLRALRRRR